MSTFLTPPVWYDKNGNLIEMLTGKSVDNSSVVIGSSAKTEDVVTDSIVIYGYATGDLAKPVDNAIVIGKEASVVSASGAIAIGGGNSVVADGAIAIGYNAGAGVSGAIAIGDGAIAIGRNAGARASGAIAIGDGASATSPNTIQLGKSGTAYTLKVGSGAEISGTGSILEIGSIKFKRMTVSNNKVTISSQGVYLCCTTKSGTSGIVICFIGDLNGNATVLESSTSLCAYVAKDPGTSAEVHQIQASSGVTLNYCFKIIST